jgi:nucleoside-triphosphatase THEP1
MIGYVVTTGQGEGDGFLAGIAQALAASGLSLAGAIQSNYVFDPERRCHMDLTLLGSGQVIRISQDRGRHARGCRLDAQGLAFAVGQVEARLDRGEAALLIVNKFGKSELEGEGFRDVIGKALVAGVPVLTTISPAARAGFLDFAGEFAVELPPDMGTVLDWCLRQAAASAA